MPAWRVAAQNRTVRQYDVVASDGPEQNYICHVALSDDMTLRSINAQSRDIPIVHMGPPLGQTTIGADAIGTLQDGAHGLSPGELLQIKAFVDERLGERRSQGERQRRSRGLSPALDEYVIRPEYVEPSGDVSLWRFSCAGFVLRAYEEANIALIAKENLPLVTLEELKRAYPRFSGLLDRAEVRETLGIGGPELNWPVILAGYVLNALDRQPNEIRFIPLAPSRDDARFPH